MCVRVSVCLSVSVSYYHEGIASPFRPCASDLNKRTESVPPLYCTHDVDLKSPKRMTEVISAHSVFIVGLDKISFYRKLHFAQWS